MSEMRKAIKNPKVVYQGIEGAYTQEAALMFFGEEANTQAVKTWEEVFALIENGSADYGVFPIENSSTGSIIQVYDLLLKYGHFIVGEQTVKIDHCLMGKKGVQISDIEKIYSHEQGLLQCADFLNTYPNWEKNAVLNTAIACKFVADKGDKTMAAIGSKRCGKIYGLQQICDNINMSDKNYTRFIVVSKFLENRGSCEKLSTVFALPHKKGALSEIINLCANGGLNLTKIESRPILGKTWEYRFFMDFASDINDEGLEKTLEKIKDTAVEFKLLGRYEPCKIVEGI